MSANRPAGGAALVRLRLTGVAFLLVLASLVALVVGIYQKRFTPVVEVTLLADRVGNQLSAPTDVKLRGLIVGEVRDVSTTDDGAAVELALDPAHVDLIPANVQARLLPKTLFGEKYVSLVLPDEPADRTVRAGDVIPQDRTQAARETEQALNNLLPALRALNPDDVSVTLNAVSSALRGRGDRIGENLTLLRDYLRELNPELPVLEDNLEGLADFAETLTGATPDVVEVLDNLSAVSGSLVDQHDELDRFLGATVDSSGRLASLLRDNTDRIVTLAADGLPTLQEVARHAPTFPCFTEGMVKSDKAISDAFGVEQPGLHITLKLHPAREAYQPNRDEPAYLDDRAPSCFGMPAPPVPMGDVNFRDGFRDELGPDVSSPSGQRTLINGIVAPVLGVPADEVPDLAHLLFAPVARGTAVGLSFGGHP